MRCSEDGFEPSPPTTRPEPLEAGRGTVWLVLYLTELHRARRTVKNDAGRSLLRLPWPSGPTTWQSIPRLRRYTTPSPCVCFPHRRIKSGFYAMSELREILAEMWGNALWGKMTACALVAVFPLLAVSLYILVSAVRL
jgi:hypothetical protein